MNDTKAPLILAGIVLGLCTLSPAHALDPEIENCIQRNAPQSTAIQRIEMRSVDRVGYEKTLGADVYLKRTDDGARMVAYFTEPDDISGTRLLVIEKAPANEMYVYMPSLFKIRKVSAKRISSSMYGSDFSYEDIERFYGMLSNEQPVQGPDDTIDGIPVFSIESRPAADSGSRYEAVVAYFDQQHCVIQRVDFFEPGRKLRKQLVTDPNSIEPVGSTRLPRAFTMTDLRSETVTRLRITQADVDIPLDDVLFEPDKLKEFRGIQ